MTENWRTFRISILIRTFEIKPLLLYSWVNGRGFLHRISFKYWFHREKIRTVSQFLCIQYLFVIKIIIWMCRLSPFIRLRINKRIKFQSKAQNGRNHKINEKNIWLMLMKSGAHTLRDCHLFDVLCQVRPSTVKYVMPVMPLMSVVIIIG